MGMRLYTILLGMLKILLFDRVIKWVHLIGDALSALQRDLPRTFWREKEEKKEYSGTCTCLILKIPSELQNHRPKFQF